MFSNQAEIKIIDVVIYGDYQEIEFFFYRIMEVEKYPDRKNEMMSRDFYTREINGIHYQIWDTRQIETQHESNVMLKNAKAIVCIDSSGNFDISCQKLAIDYQCKYLGYDSNKMNPDNCLIKVGLMIEKEFQKNLYNKIKLIWIAKNYDNIFFAFLPLELIKLIADYSIKAELGFFKKADPSQKNDKKIDLKFKENCSLM